jgi:hypothetical protein
VSAQARAHEHSDAGERAPALKVELELYRALHRHAELELELAGRAEIDELAALGERWQQLIAELPVRPPAQAAALLEQAQLIHERTRIELIRLREALLSELAGTARARRTADGYGGQLRRRPLTDLTA